ncbi:MAG: CBS domain-containing protein [Gammaproteobacteria bacterium]|nr:MAG: CBS domain-containing protein [Gammaproteobacteria bacterium]
MADISQRIERMVAVLDENKTALDAARLMSERFIGSVVVTGSATVKGIFTERDLMKCVIAAGLDPAAVKLKDSMCQRLVTVPPDENVERCLELMKQNQCRHLLVFEGKEFVGIVSLRDLVQLLLDEKERLIQELTRYITS